MMHGMMVGMMWGMGLFGLIPLLVILLAAALIKFLFFHRCSRIASPSAGKPVAGLSQEAEPRLRLFSR